MNGVFVEFLVRTGALKFGDFTLKSGRKSPYFVNMGVVSSGRDLYTLSGFFADKIVQLGCPKIIYGPAYKGIPLCVGTSISLYNEQRTPTSWLFNRKEVKTHGDVGAFVGEPPKEGEDAIIVDDVLTTGGTKFESVELLESMGVKVKALVIGVDREEKGKEKSAVEEFTAQTGVPVHSIVKISDVFEQLKGKEFEGKVLVTDEIYSAFQKYRDEYGVK